MHAASAIHQDDLTFFHFIFDIAAMRIGAGRADQNERKFDRSAEGCRGFIHQSRNVVSRHARLYFWIDMAIGGERNIIGRLHQGQLRRGFKHPATARNRLSGDEFDARFLGLDARRNEIPCGLFNRDGLLEGFVFSQNIDNQFERRGIFVPCAHVISDFHGLPNGRLLEKRRNHRKLALGRYHDPGKALRSPPAYAGKIGEGRAGLDDQSADALLLHKSLSLLDPGLMLSRCDRLGTRGEVLKLRA